jgi:hypothetical protein
MREERCQGRGQVKKSKMANAMFDVILCLLEVEEASSWSCHDFFVVANEG